MDIQQNDRWWAEFQTHGQVKIRAKRSRLLLLLAGTILMSLASLWVMTESQIIGAIGVVFFGVLGIPVILYQAIRPRVVVVDRRGITIPTRSTFTIEWSGVEHAASWGQGASASAMVMVHPDLLEAYKRSLGPFSGWLLGANRAVTGTPSVHLPSSLEGGVATVVVFLDAVHKDYLAHGQSPPQHPDFTG